ncbi:MAG: hypothetical protein GKR96_03995 [Gammaproteobacteria bacterium]|nr:hypothetical protein [Gammaproteobacteria bacterium]
MSVCVFAQADDYRLNPSKVKGPDACGECHEDSVSAWKLSHHATSFKSMPRSEGAREIADKMGIKRIKSESDCLTCHFTASDSEGSAKPIAGISCESCHGAGVDWIDVHSDFGGKDVKAEDEDPAHKVKRYADSEAAGMIRPSNTYEVAENCFGCHTVPNENLVNTGGHVAGSNFELVRWTQGEVRHNIWYTEDNNEASVERRRMLYVVGKLLDLEYALRGVSKATVKAEYALSMAKRAKKATAFVKKISTLIDAAELAEVLGIVGTVKLKLNNEAALLEAADSISAVSSSFASNYDGSTFAGVDELLATPDKYKGDVFSK